MVCSLSGSNLLYVYWPGQLQPSNGDWLHPGQSTGRLWQNGTSAQVFDPVLRRLFPYAALTDFYNRDGVFTARYELDLYIPPV